MCYTARQYDNRLRKLQELEGQKRELEAKIAALQDEIKKDMGEQEEVTTGTFKISFKRIFGTRFDTKRFKAEQADVYKAYQLPTETRRFTFAAL